MSKGGVIVLIIAALVFCGLGFVIGQVVQAAGNTAGSADDPVVTQSYVDKLVGERVSSLQTEIEQLQALVSDAGISAPSDGQGDPNTADPSTEKKVKATDSVNLRSSANANENNVLKTVASGTEMTYISSTTGSDGEWYQVRLSDGTEGFVAGWFCSQPY